MHGGSGEGLGQGQDVGIGAHVLLHRVLQSLLEGGPGLQAHAPGDARLPRAHNVDGAGVLLRQMAAAHHGKTVERVEGIGEAVLADVLLVGGEILAVAVHVRQDVHRVMLEHLIQLSQVRPALLVEPAVADAGDDEHAVICQHPLVAYYLGRECLHHLDGIGAHAGTVVEVGRHAEHYHIVLLFCPVHIGALIRRFPTDGLHLLRPAGVDLNLPTFGIQHRVAAEELLSHLLFHQHTLLIELVAHLAVGGYGHEVLPVHHLWHMVGRDAAPMADAGGAVLVAARVAAVGVALGVANEDGHVGVVDVLVHDYVVASLGIADVHQVVVVLRVVAGDLTVLVEFLKQFRAQDGLHLRHRGAGMQAIGEQQQHVLFLHAHAVQLIQAGTDGYLAVTGGLVAALDNVRDDERHLAALVGQLCQRGHADGVADAV